MPSRPPRRVVLFAHYDRDNVVDAHVLHSLRGLRTVAEAIVFASDSPLPEAERGKLRGVADVAWAARHGEYDFGSWKRALASLPSLDGWDEVILANDSCYAPLVPFGDAFRAMADTPVHAWGPTLVEESRAYPRHLNSYFLVLRRPVFLHPEFRAFFEGVRPQPDFDAVVRAYEIGFSQWLTRRGFAFSSLLPSSQEIVPYTEDYLARLVPQGRTAWIKVKALTANPTHVPNLAGCLAALPSSYPRELIRDHLRRLIGTDAPSCLRVRAIRRRIAGCLRIERIESESGLTLQATARLGARVVFSWKRPPEERIQGFLLHERVFRFRIKRAPDGGRQTDAWLAGLPVYHRRSRQAPPAVGRA